MISCSALYISIDTPHLVLFCLGSRYFAFSPDIFIVEVHSVEPPEIRSPGLRRSVFGGRKFPPCLRPALQSFSTLLSGAVPSPQRPSPIG
jgi:hypothetical protein